MKKKLLKYEEYLFNGFVVRVGIKKKKILMLG